MIRSPEQDEYVARLNTAHDREPVRAMALFLARAAAGLPQAVTVHPTSRTAIAAFKTACAAAGIPEPTRGEIKDAVAYLNRRGLAASWWSCAPRSTTTSAGSEGASL